jgi:glycosyltransferase involved in cell wall biosynthesis
MNLCYKYSGSASGIDFFQDMDMKFSIVVCTFNRSASLRRMLKSLQDLVIPDHITCEVIVVDNHSDDDTRLVVEETAKHFTSEIRYVFEDKKGLSHARNRGIKEAGGEIIAFTDDDVIADKHWIQNIDRAFKEYADAACAGGKILPVWEIPRPKWLKPDLYGYLALLDKGDSSAYMDALDIWGANFAVKSEMFKKYGLFDTNLGRTPAKLYSGEEAEFLLRLQNAGEKILYYPLSIIHHHIPACRMSKKYMRRWEFDNGEMEGILMKDTKHSDTMIYHHHPTKITSLKHVMVSLLKIVFFADDRLNHELKICHISGFLSGRMKRMLAKS